MNTQECIKHRKLGVAHARQEHISGLLERIRQLEKDVENNNRWMRDVLTDFDIPFPTDDHIIGFRAAIWDWMYEHA